MNKFYRESGFEAARGSYEELKNAEADYIINNIAEIENI